MYRYWEPAGLDKKVERTGSLDGAMNRIAWLVENENVAALHLCTGLTGWRMFTMWRLLDGNAMEDEERGQSDPPVFLYGPRVWELDVHEFHGDEATQKVIFAFLKGVLGGDRGLRFYRAR